MKAWKIFFLILLAVLLCSCSSLPDPLKTSGVRTSNVIGAYEPLKAIGLGAEEGDLGKNHLAELINCKGDIKYTPVPAFQAGQYTSVKIKDGEIVIDRLSFPSSVKEVNGLLPNLSMDVSNEKVDGEVQAFWLKSNLYRRKIVMDFMKSRTEPIIDAGGVFYGYGRVGAGLRIKIDLWTSESSFDGSLVGLAASAKAKNSYGSITAETIGVNNSEVTLSMPFTADFSEGSIQKIIEALAVIKSRLHDEEKTSLTPHYLARISCVTK